MLSLRLFHGRKNPEEQLDNWGEQGPLLKGITYIGWTYGMMRVTFESAEYFTKAKLETGWTEWDDRTLEVKRNEDTIMCELPGNAVKPRRLMFYGDFEIFKTVENA